MKAVDGFPLELDHVTIFVNIGAPELQTLEALGLQPLGEKTAHTGMGTVGTSVFFDNAYLELVWIADPVLAREKWGEANVDLESHAPGGLGRSLPFGLVLRAREPQENAVASAPFSASALGADWTSPPMRLLVADEEGGLLFIVVPPGLTYPAFQADLPPVAHPLGVRELTGVQVTGRRPLSEMPIARTLQDAGIITYREGPGPLLELTFDEGAQGQSADARPTLPLLLHY